MYVQVRDVITRCEQCDRVKTSFFTPYSRHVLSKPMWFSWRVTTNLQGQCLLHDYDWAFFKVGRACYVVGQVIT
jgi:hypothetical protein